MRLRIKQVEQRKGKDEKDKDRKKIDRNQVSRAQNKQRKKEAKLAKEMVELQAAENQQDRIRLMILIFRKHYASIKICSILYAAQFYENEMLCHSYKNVIFIIFSSV